VFQFPNSGAGAALALLVPLFLLMLAASRCGLWHRIQSLPPAGRVLAVVGLLALIGFGGEKEPPPPPVARRWMQLVTVLNDGTLKDSSGTLVSGVQAKALEQFAAETYQMAQATAQVVEDARLACVALTNQLAQADYSVAYLSLDMPRGTPAEPNHNIMVSFEKIQQTTTNLTAWVWFSEMPATNVSVRIDYSLLPGVWAPLPAATNFYPATESVNGVDCVRYVYAIPNAMAGTPLRMQYEIEFGGHTQEEYLSVPETGVTVEVGEETFLPHTGWVTIGEGADAIQVHVIGGIAVEAIQNGISYKGYNL